MHKQKLIDDVTAGDVVLECGYAYRVTSSTYDKHGNTGHSPRYVLDCVGVTGREPFADSMSIGRSVGLPVTVEA